METITTVNAAVNSFVWGVPAMICIVGVGLWLSVQTKFIQFRRFGTSMRETFGKMFHRADATDGAVTPFQAVCSALLGMCTKFAEVTLAVRFREKNREGDWVGGPMYYIKNGLPKKWRFLAVLYAILGMLTVFGTGNATQVNAIITAVDTAILNFHQMGARQMASLNLVIGILIALTVALVLVGGLKRIGNVAEKLVPFMALVYVLMALGVLVLNLNRVPEVLASIVRGAFSPSAVTGGAVGSMFLCMKKGVSRGIFSNEAGLGTGSIAHAASDVDDPIRQGYFGIFEVFADTIIICSMTAFVILVSGEHITYGAAAGAELTIGGFTAVYGIWASLLAAVAMCCFAFSTIIGWGLYGTRCLEFLVGSKANRGFMIVYSFVAIIGATVDLGLLWDLSETFNGMMVIPNLIALFLLSGTVAKMVRETKI